MMTAATTENPTLLDDLLAGMTDKAVITGIEVSGLALDSRNVWPGCVFFALAGSRGHGMAFARDAISKGAAAVLYDSTDEGDDLAASMVGIDGPPFVPVRELGRKVGLIADRFFHSPSSRLDIIGITGTNAKTSVSHALAQVLSENNPCAVIGTLGWGFRDNMQDTWHTTPDAVTLHSILAELERLGAKAVAMEVSSHGLDQGRTQGVRFRAAVFTNITRDHLDYHGTMEAYVEAKLRLLRSPGLEFAVVNLDDPYALQILAAVPEGVRKYGFTCKEEGEHEGVDVVTARNIQHGHQGLTFNIDYRGDAASVASPLFGDFNVENLAATLTVLLAAGFSLSDAGRRLGAVRAVPGRMERFTCGRQSPTVIVDYAHTPDALERVLKSLRAHCQADLWLVFGCGGDRDRGKRALMGHIAEQWADRVVITDDNPRSEDGNAIVQEILEGCRSLDVNVIRDRAHAIRTVIGRARPNDIVVVAGKGHETTQEIQGIKHPFSDRVVVRETLLAATEGSGGRRA